MNDIKNSLEYLPELLEESITPEEVLRLNIPHRKPRTLEKVEHQVLVGLNVIATEIKNLENKISDSIPAIRSILEKELRIKQEIFENKTKQLRMGIDEIREILIDSKPNRIEKSIATYIKADSISHSRFLENVEIVESFLNSLIGFHKKVLRGLVIKFVTSKEISSKAKYDKRNDVVKINVSKMGKNDNGYGGLNYVVLHELGHRYLTLYMQRVDFDSKYWETTEYSKVDSFTGEEKFAELFALSHWKNKYLQFRDKISEFEKAIN